MDEQDRIGRIHFDIPAGVSYSVSIGHNEEEDAYAVKLLVMPMLKEEAEELAMSLAKLFTDDPKPVVMN